MTERDPRNDQNTGVGYESGDLPAAKVIATLAGLALLLVLAGLCDWTLLKAFLWTAAETPATVPRRTLPLVEPRLQISPPKDLAVLRAEEDRLLHAGGWVDQAAGIARIPVEQAMALLVKRSQSSRESRP